MSDQENFTATREALAAGSKLSGPRDHRYEVAFRHYLAAVAYHEDRQSAGNGPAVVEEPDIEASEGIADVDISWDLRDASVRDVMTNDVVCVEDSTTFRQIVDRLSTRHISAVPVVDAERRVVGIVSESDLLAKLVRAGGHLPRIKGAWRTRSLMRRKSEADTAAGLMTAPAVTTTPDTSVVEAARTAAAEFVRRMPVVDESGVLVGIVTRSDLLSVFDRSDDDIRIHIVEDILRQDLCINPLSVRVTVREGVVSLHGELEKEALVRLVVAAVRATVGVVNVKNELSYRIADVPTTPVLGPIY